MSLIKQYTTLSMGLLAQWTTRDVRRTRENLVNHSPNGSWFTGFSKFTGFYEITKEKACQLEENLLYFCDQVAYSHQIHEMTWQTNHSDWKNESTDSATDTKSAEQSDENISRQESFKKERKRLSVKGKKNIH